MNKTQQATRRGILMILGSAVLSAVMTILNAVQNTIPIRAVAVAGIAIGVGYLFASLMSPDKVTGGRAGLAAASFMLVPLAVGSPSKTSILLAITVITLAASLPRLRIASLFGVIVLFYGITIVYPGLSSLILTYGTFFSICLGVIIARASGHRDLTLAPAYAVLMSFAVLAVTGMEIATRSALPGAQLPYPQWALLVLLVIGCAMTLSSPSLLRATGRYALPVMLAAALVGMVVTPPKSMVDLVKADANGVSLLAAIAGSSGSTKMIGDEGAGPRAEFRGVDFEGCDLFSIRDCLITYYDTYAKENGIQAALDNIVSKVKNNEGITFATHCHQVVHNLGQMAYELADGDFAMISSYDPQVCGTGFVHGLYEKYFDRYGSYIFTQTGDVCNKMNLTSDWYAWTCSHILGHTLAAKLPNNPIQAAEYCMPLLSGNNFADCSSGAWMNFWADDSVIEWYGENAMFKPQEVFNVCYGAVRESKYYCYQEIFPALVKISNNDLSLMAKWCEQYSEPARSDGPTYLQGTQNYSERCMQGVARAVAVTSNYDYRVGIVRCASIDGTLRDTCLAGMAASIALNTGSITASMEACERVRDRGYRDYCFIWVKQVRATLTGGPNAENVPEFGEVRVPDRPFMEALPPKTSTDTKP